MEFDFDAINEEDSPFPEVRASVSNINPEMPVMTLCMWLIGLLLCMIAGQVASPAFRLIYASLLSGQ